MYEGFVYMNMPGAQESKKSELDPLDLGLWIVVNCHIGSKTQTQKTLYKSNLCSETLRQLSSLRVCVLACFRN